MSGCCGDGWEVQLDAGCLNAWQSHSARAVEGAPLMSNAGLMAGSEHAPGDWESACTMPDPTESNSGWPSQNTIMKMRKKAR